MPRKICVDVARKLDAIAKDRIRQCFTNAIGRLGHFIRYRQTR